MSGNQKNNRDRSKSDLYADNDRQPIRKRRSGVVNLNETGLLKPKMSLEEAMAKREQKNALPAQKQAEKNAMNSVSVARHNMLNTKRSAELYGEDMWVRNFGEKSRKVGDAMKYYGGGAIGVGSVGNPIVSGLISAAASAFAIKSGGAFYLAGTAISNLGGGIVDSFDKEHDELKAKKTAAEEEFANAKEAAKDSGIETWQTNTLSEPVFMKKRHLESLKEHLKRPQVKNIDDDFETQSRTRSKSTYINRDD